MLDELTSQRRLRIVTWLAFGLIACAWMQAGCSRSRIQAHTSGPSLATVHLFSDSRCQAALSFDDGRRLLTINMTDDEAVADGLPVTRISSVNSGECGSNAARPTSADFVLYRSRQPFWFASRIAYDERRFPPGERVLIAGYLVEDGMATPNAFFELPTCIMQMDFRRFEPPAGGSTCGTLWLDAPYAGELSGVIGGPVIRRDPIGWTAVALIVDTYTDENRMTVIVAKTIPAAVRMLGLDEPESRG